MLKKFEIRNSTAELFIFHIEGKEDSDSAISKMEIAESIGYFNFRGFLGSRQQTRIYDIRRKI